MITIAFSKEGLVERSRCYNQICIMSETDIKKPCHVLNDHSMHITFDALPTACLAHTL
uniref:AlNc14C524G12043 protein n=1 Tax=Albugo laibachii Nc14 TaxID=890382 RepID=F0X0V3_9STRA|nr:AlNc14C524G12043 [Albugo laibachii Nc14]|eukprot:CCA27398.1 AlNc14C524G12043 [Albugo laibachii Nc14]